MKLIVLFVGLCVSVGVLCSVPDQIGVGLAHSNSSDDMLASSKNRKKRMLPLIALFSGVVGVSAVIIAVDQLIVNKRPIVPPPQPSDSVSLVSVNRLVNDLYKEFNNKNELCHREQNRHRRNSLDSNCLLPVIAIVVGQPYYNEIELIAEQLRNRLDTITTDVSNDNTHAVNDFTTIEAPANQNHSQSIDLTITMRATLTYDNTAQNRRAAGVGGFITERMQEMDWYHEGDRNTNDERGHLLADSLGGPRVPWNFVPQSAAVNRAVEIRGDLHVTYVCY